MIDFSGFAIKVLAVFCLVFLSLPTAYAEQPILTIEGKTQLGQPRHYSLQDLKRFPSRTIETHTPWHDGLMKFEGVRLKDLLEDVGTQGDVIRVIALNDYSALIPVTDADKFDPILAYKLNGDYMRIEDKGPLFVIYPFDDHPKLNAEIYHSRSVWQARTIVIKSNGM